MTGALPKTTKADKKDQKYLDFLKTQDCCNEGGSHWGDVVPAHTPHPASSGTGTKAADKYAIPFCVGCHNEQHTGWKTFCAKYDFDYVEAREYFWDKYQREINA